MNTATLTRMGDTIRLDSFHQDLLETLTGDTVPQSLTVEQGRNLLEKAREATKTGMSAYGSLAEGFLGTLETLLK